VNNILARAHRELLDAIAWSNALLAFDFDGTLAPIVAHPNEAAMRPETRELLAEVAARYPVIVLSGRAQRDVAQRVQGVGVRQVIGNHGIEPFHGSVRLVDEVKRWVPVLRARLAPLKGVVIEDKGFSVAVHYRQSREKKKARERILEVAGELAELRVVGGKQVVNLLPAGAPHKGIALIRERERLRCDTALYVGDDDTDEDVFALDEPGRLFTIRVGAKRTSAAMYCIPNQHAIDDLLRELADLRTGSRQSSQVAP
jgi:trehalose 6-phosphate phosphatase